MLARFNEALDVFGRASMLSPSDENLKMNLEATRIDQMKHIMELEIQAAAEVFQLLTEHVS